MLKIKVRYSPEDEVVQVLEILEIVGWLEQNKYRFTLPKSIFEAPDKFKANKSAIEIIIEQEFDPNDYDIWSKIIMNGWDVIAEEFTTCLSSLVNIDLKEKYLIILTKYGPGGGYNLRESSISLNIQLRDSDQSVNSIVHEIVHLSIESLILKYEIEHWQKERIVDLILFKFSIVESQLQREPENAKEIKEIFNNYYPDMEKIISVIGGLQDKSKEH